MINYQKLIKELREQNCDGDSISRISQAVKALETIGMCWDDSKRYARKLEHQNEILKAERDKMKEKYESALAYLKSQYDCDQCVNRECASPDIGSCSLCTMTCPCRDCINGTNWKWKEEIEE